MSPLSKVKTTFEVENTIQPIYLGGGISLNEQGSILASCLGEEVLLTDVNSGRELARIEGDDEPVTSISITPSGGYLIISSRSLLMRIFSLESSGGSSDKINPKLLRSWKPHTAPVVVSAVDQTGTLVATGAADGSLKVWDIRGGYATHSFHGHSGLVTALHFFQSKEEGKDIEKESSKNKKKSQNETNSSDNVTIKDRNGTVGASPEVFKLASGGEDGKIRIWDLNKRKSIATLDSHVSLVRSLEFSPEDDALVSASRDKTAIVWDIRSGKPKRVIPILETVETAGFLKGGEIIYTGGETGRLRLWEAASGREITPEQEIMPEEEGIYTVIHCSLRQWLISVHADQTLRIHSLDSILEFCQGQSLEPLPILRHISGNYDEVIDLAYAGPDQSLLALATNSETLRIVSLDTSSAEHFGADVAHLKGHSDIIICLDISWSGHWIATGAKDRTAKLWRLDPSTSSYTCYCTFTGHTETIGAISLPKTVSQESSPAYTNPLEHPPPFLLTGSQDRTIKRWTIPPPSSSNKLEPSKPPRALYTRKAHEKDINALDINSISTLAASASQDRLVKIWSIEEGEPIGVLRGHKRGVWAVKFSPSFVPPLTIEGGQSHRNLILTGSGDKTIKIWSLGDYSCLRTLEGHTASILKVVWLPPSPSESSDSDTNAQTNPKNQETLIASAGGDALLKIWSAQSAECVTTLDNHSDRIWALATPPYPLPFPSSTSTSSPKPSTLISGGADSIVTFWRDITSTVVARTIAASSARLEADQRLQNLVHAGSYREAITLALALDQPGRLLSLLTGAAEASLQQQQQQQQSQEEVDNNSTSEDVENTGTGTGNKEVDAVLASLADVQLAQLLRRVRDWNTNARTAPIAQRVLNVLVKAYPASTFARLRMGGPGGGGGAGDQTASDTKGAAEGTNVKEVLRAIEAYTERHYRRMEELLLESWVVEFTLREMDEVAGTGVTDVAMIEA
ncbi:MAG: U3 small nucleolar RNA-associated protein 13 [Cirrosporium novae-zelandiae]|nr:MAG: U3 small nucleolar RNA-associated protein 13 [Cirrosporium novae-zelandiae]